MAASYRQVYVRCPFYKGDNGINRVICEGLTGDESSNVSLFFAKREDFDIQMDAYCCKDFEKCDIHHGLMRRYEEDD